MGALTFDALLRSLKQGRRDERGAGKGEAAPDAVYYLHGDEYVLKDEAVQALVDRVLDAGARDFNFDQRSAGELDAEAFHSLVNTPPLLAAVRVVVLRGVENVRKTSKVRQALVRYLQAPNPTTLLILVQGAGEPPDAELARSATTVAIEPLLEQAGMTGVRILMALGTALLGTALGRAELDRGTPPGRLAAALLGQLRAARPFGLGSWEQTAARWASWATHWSAASLRAALRLALDADRALKSTTLTDERGILVQLVLALGVLQREAA